MKTISIITVVDIVGVFASGTLSKNIYMIDNNKANGSTDEGTGVLKTMVEEGDILVWIVQALEPEAYASITGIEIEKEYCEPKQKPYEGTDITFWVGRVKKNLKAVPYNLKIKVGNRDKELLTPNPPYLIGRLTN
ncbi:MAG: hypothetical protein KAW12_15370 [Candidatus Aminicenantes bacterium]|nr:hypothetical protein [Candidatus Aminicenantes bacterium]